MKNILLGVITAAFLGACSTSPKVVDHGLVAGVPQVAASKPVNVVAVAAPALPPYKDPNNILYRERSVFFDFDNYAVKPVYLASLSAHGKFLESAPEVKIRVEGNSDDRGGSEYNLALGQRRAEAVKKVLLAQGVKEAQIEAVSYGKEKPRASGSNEQAWQQNRRADIAYP